MDFPGGGWMQSLGNQLKLGSAQDQPRQMANAQQPNSNAMRDQIFQQIIGQQPANAMAGAGQMIAAAGGGLANYVADQASFPTAPGQGTPQVQMSLANLFKPKTGGMY